MNHNNLLVPINSKNIVGEEYEYRTLSFIRLWF